MHPANEVLEHDGPRKGPELQEVNKLSMGSMRFWEKVGGETWKMARCIELEWKYILGYQGCACGKGILV